MGSKIEIFDFSGHTILSLISLLPVRAMLLRVLMGASFSGESSPIFSGGVRGLFIGG